jgi:putative DNA primase/helicase
MTTMLEHAIQLARAGYTVFPLHYPRLSSSFPATTPKYPGELTCSCHASRFVKSLTDQEIARGMKDRIERGPCEQIGKHPLWINGLFEHGHNNATNDVEKITRAWTAYPNANIGIGGIFHNPDGSTSRIVAIDVDGSADPEKDGEATIAALEQKYGPLPVTMEVKSGRIVPGRAIGGRHLIFAIPDNWAGVFKRTLGPGVDIKCAGVGYVAAPPSLHKSGQHYEWLVSSGLADAPEWLLTEASRPAEASGKSGPSTPVGDVQDLGPVWSDGLHGISWRETEDGDLEAIVGAIMALDGDCDFRLRGQRKFMSPDLFKEIHWSIRAIQDWFARDPRVSQIAFAHAHQFAGHDEQRYFQTLWNYRRPNGREFGRGHLFAAADRAAPGWRSRLPDAARRAARRLHDDGSPVEFPAWISAFATAGAGGSPSARPTAGMEGAGSSDGAAPCPSAGEQDIGDGPTLSHGNPARSAQIFRETQAKTLIWANGDYLNWENGAYAAEEVDGVASDVHKFLKRAKTRTKSETGEEKVSAFIPLNKDITEVTGALKREYHKPPMDKPRWMNGVTGPDPRNIISFPNGLLDITTGVLYAPNPNFFTYNALGFKYDPDAPEPVNFLAFLESIFAPDQVREAIPLLQKMFGYLVSGDTSMQKIFMIIGETRSGKGTLSGVIKNLLGEPNYNSSTLSRLDSKFSMESMIGKSITVIPDAHVGKKADSQVVVEILKSISGEDTQSVERKWKSDWTGVLGTRLLILANRAPKLMDTSQALANRLIVFTTPNSFEGREDFKLAEKLAAEAPGILNWALQGLKDLREDGRFILPSWASASQKEVAELGSTVQAFFNECCEFSPAGKVGKAALYEKYVAWALAAREPVTLSRRQFSADLYSIGRGKITGRKDEIKLTVTGHNGAPVLGADGKPERVTAYGGVLVKI